MERTQIVKLTKAPISEALYTIIDRLEQGHYVNPDLIMNTPEVKLAEQCVSNQGIETSKLDQGPRRILQNSLLRNINSLGSYSGKVENENGEMVPTYNGIVGRDKQIHFVLGLPASGKSSALADVISDEFNARIIDSDMIKEQIPEYNDGWGSGVVHEESRDIMYQSFYDGLKLGENLVIPRIGEPPNYIEEMMKEAKAAGYTVNVHLMDLDPNKALGRMLGRFVTTGRYIDPTWGGQYAQPGNLEKMANAYEALKNSEYCDGYSKWSNDVKYGEKSILLEYDGISGRFLDDARIDIESIKPVEPENPFEEHDAQMAIRSMIQAGEVQDAKYRRNQAEAEIREKTAIIKSDDEFRAKMREEVENMKKTQETTANIKTEEDRKLYDGYKAISERSNRDKLFSAAEKSDKDTAEKENQKNDPSIV